MNIRETKEYKTLYEFLIEKSNSANVAPVFETEDGQLHELDPKAMDVINQILEDAYIPYITEVLVKALLKPPNLKNSNETFVLELTQEELDFIYARCSSKAQRLEEAHLEDLPCYRLSWQVMSKISKVKKAQEDKK